MLDKLRENSRSFGTYLVFGALILVFVAYFGAGGAGFVDIGSGVPPWAAKVNGDEIPLRAFQNQYAALYSSYQQQMGGQFDEAMAEQFGLKETALDRLVERKLLVDLARESGIAVSNEEVAKELRAIPAFQVNGHFDFDTYRNVLRTRMGITPDKFEREVREDLLVRRMVAQIRQSVRATDEEVRAEFRREHDKANLTFVRLSAGHPTFQQAGKPTDAEVKAWLATDEGRREAEARYEEQRFRYDLPKRVKAQHILVKVAEDAPQEEVDAATQKLLDAKKKVEAGADFGELARELSEDPGSKDSGGDLGFFGPGTMAKPFEEAAFALAPGQLSDVVRTRFGLHLIKVNEVQEAKQQGFDEVKEEIAREILGRRGAEKAARARAEEILAEVKKGRSLAELFPAPAENAGHVEPVLQDRDAIATAQETGLFPVDGEYVPRLGPAAELVAAARAAEAGAVLDRVFEMNGTFVVAQVTERQKPDMANWEADEARMRQRVVARKEAALVSDLTRKLRESAKVEKNPALFAAARH